MCYAIPGLVKGFDGKHAIVDYFGEEKKALSELLDLKAGDYVYAQGGFVITRVSAEEAGKTLETWKDLFFELKEIDQKASRLSPWGAARYDHVRGLMERALSGGKLTQAEILGLLNIADPREQEFLLSAANHIRQEHHSNSCCVHGIIEISNMCAEQCHYCGISAWNTKIPRYRLSKEEILSAVQGAVDGHGFKALVLQSGEDAGRSVDELADIIRAIKKRFGVLIFVSFGEVGEEGLEKLYAAGARGVLLRFETSNAELFKKLHPGSTLERRLAEIRKAHELGFLIVTGALVGLPGQTQQDVARDIELAGELNVEMLSLGPFLPHPATPLANIPAPDMADLIQTLAVARFALPAQVKILVTTGLETLSPDARRAGLMAGANSVMLNVTPVDKRPLYDIYPKRAHQDDPLAEQITATIALLESIGRAPTDLSVGAG
ncbi:MAG: [FeFe] hydrogenase H-cluster radical SAM maturase HydE [Candidatus Omnitrophica bacterium]|nr:[FeFe] hydrogenase H-cluster radical SAM maturase HydE [Candidatus Omnitrophota bacterium]